MMRKGAIVLASAALFGLLGCGQEGSGPQQRGEQGADFARSSTPAQSDQELLLHVKNALKAQKDPDASQVDVAVSGGVVTLSGMVRDPEAREKIVLMVAGMDGVQTVIDYLVLPTG